MKDRIKQLMEAKHMTQQTFANFIGMSAASLSNIFNNRTRPTLNTVEAIKSKIPELSLEWIMFGKGSMYETDAAPSSTPSADGVDNDVEPSFNFDGATSDDLFSRHEQPKPPVAAPRQQLQQVQKPEIKYVERPQRKITEIRIFYDDGTYETFSPNK